MECIEAGRIKMAWEHGLNAVEQQYQNIIHVFYDSNYAMQQKELVERNHNEEENQESEDSEDIDALMDRMSEK